MQHSTWLRVQWQMSPALGRLRYKDAEFEASLDYSETTSTPVPQQTKKQKCIGYSRKRVTD